ncbi:MAG: toll/interleukin-1 receptor domain-containing protein [Bacteroidetes bacterium]|nr:MAG: toll/interleukin-1 receptor domain-containing protein [Bacteroidota bacterium]
MPSKVFVSYSRADSAFVKKLTADLKTLGVDIWLDQLDIPLGSLWDIEIETALNECNCVLFVASQASVQSKNALDEVYAALEENKRVVPIRIDNCNLPFRLKRLQHYDVTDSYDEVLQTVSNTLMLKVNEDRQPQQQTEEEQLREEEWHKQQKLLQPQKSLRKVYYIIGSVVAGIAIIVWIIVASSASHSSFGFSKVDTSVTSSTLASDTFHSRTSTDTSVMQSTTSIADSPKIHTPAKQPVKNSNSLKATEKYADPKKQSSAGKDFLPANGKERPKSSDDLVMEGGAYYDALKYPLAREKWNEAASLGNSDAMRNIGLMYELGRGENMNYDKALDWFNAAKNKGHTYVKDDIARVQGKKSLSLVLEGGAYYNADKFSLAREKWDEAAKLGNSDAMRNIGIMYEYGRGTSIDLEQALKWYNASKQRGNLQVDTDIMRVKSKQ